MSAWNGWGREKSLIMSQRGSGFLLIGHCAHEPCSYWFIFSNWVMWPLYCKGGRLLQLKPLEINFISTLALWTGHKQIGATCLQNNNTTMFWVSVGSLKGVFTWVLCYVLFKIPVLVCFLDCFFGQKQLVRNINMNINTNKSHPTLLSLPLIIVSLKDYLSLAFFLKIKFQMISLSSNDLSSIIWSCCFRFREVWDNSKVSRPNSISVWGIHDNQT